MNAFQNFFSFFGRLLMAALFLPAGLQKLAGFEGTVGYIASKGLPAPTLLATATILVEIGASLALVFGFKTRIAALVLAAFTLVATVVFHNYWAASDVAMQMTQSLMFFKNIAVIGGLLTLAAWGAGALSLDAKRHVQK